MGYRARWLLLVGLVLALIGVGLHGVADAQARTIIRLAHSEAEVDLINTPYKTLTSVFKTIVEQQTGGRIQVQVFPAGQMGDLRSMMEQTARGTLQMTTGQNSGLIATYYPDVQALEIPYAFRNTEIGRMVLNGPFGQELTEKIAEATGLRVLAWLPSAFRSFANNTREIRTPDDLRGLRIRTMEIPIHVEMVRALGASPTPISWEELYIALQTGVVDGHENAPYVMLLGKLEEVTKYYTLDNHFLNIAVLMINERFYRSLSPEDQEIIAYAAREAQLAFLGVVKAKESEDMIRLAERGVRIYAPTPEEHEQFRQAAQPAVIELLRKQINPEVIDAMFAAIEEAERQVQAR